MGEGIKGKKIQHKLQISMVYVWVSNKQNSHYRMNHSITHTIAGISEFYLCLFVFLFHLFLLLGELNPGPFTLLGRL